MFNCFFILFSFQNHAKDAIASAAGTAKDKISEGAHKLYNNAKEFADGIRNKNETKEEPKQETTL